MARAVRARAVLPEQHVLLKQPYALELYLLKQYVLLLEQCILLKQPYMLELYLHDQCPLLEQFCSSLSVARAVRARAVLA